MRKKLLHQNRRRIPFHDTGLSGKDVTPLYFHEIITDDQKYLPPSAKDVYDVKAELLSLHEKIDWLLTGESYVGGTTMRKRKASRSHRGSVRALPAALSSISEAIEKSKEIVNRPQDTSDEIGTVCAQETWQRAVDILAAHTRKVWMYARVKVKAPIISPGPKGSVDIYWLPFPYGLLLNVPANLEEPVTYYGDDAENPDSNYTSGKIQPTEKIDPGVLAWLAHMEEKRSKPGR